MTLIRNCAKLQHLDSIVNYRPRGSPRRFLRPLPDSPRLQLMRRPGWWAVALAGAFAVAASRPLAGGGPGHASVIRSLKFTGNKSIDKTTLSVAIGTTNSSWFARNAAVRWIGLGEKRYLDETEFRRDVLRLILLYRQSGFLEVKVDTAVIRDPKYAWITFKITEGPPIVVTSFTRQRARFPARVRPSSRGPAAPGREAVQPLSLPGQRRLASSGGCATSATPRPMCCATSRWTRSPAPRWPRSMSCPAASPSSAG